MCFLIKVEKLLKNTKIWEKINITIKKGFSSEPVFKPCVCYFLSNFYFLPNDSPSKAEKCFLFHLKSSFCSQDFQIFVILSLPFHTFQIQKNKWKWNNL